jgi:hypothetical protein
MTPQEIEEELSFINEQALLADGFREALLGIDVIDYIAVYDYEKCVDILMRQGMSKDDAIEYMDFNVLGAKMGEYTPRYVKI